MLSFLNSFYGPDLRLLHGAAPGADTLADEVAEALGIIKRTYPADWTGACISRCKDGHRKMQGGRSICPAAGIYRNEQMADLVASWMHQQHSGQLIAFPGGNGTAHMMSYCEQVGIPVDPQWQD